MQNQLEEKFLITKKQIRFSWFEKFFVFYTLIFSFLVFLQWDLGTSVLSFVLSVLVLPLLILVFPVLLIVSLVYIPIRWRKNTFRAFLPLIINIIPVLAFLYLPDVRLNIDFMINKQAYKEVSQNILNEKIQFDRNDGGVLPLQYRYLSKGHFGWVSIEKSQADRLIYFYRFEDSLECTVAGYVYSLNNLPPPQKNNDFSGINSKILEPHWYLFSGSFYDC